MRIGTKSILFGVHALWVHPIVVALAWRKYHGQWPKHLTEWVAIFCHDLGYWGKPNMDGPEGKQHPWDGAWIAERVIRFLGHGDAPSRIAVTVHVLGHSRSFCKEFGFALSPLCAPDKLSILLEPSWFYFLRATLSGEIKEFVGMAARYGYSTESLRSRWQWLKWYKAKVRHDFKDKKAGQ